MTFSSPFQPFVYRWSRLVDAVGNEEDLDTKSHLELLYKILEGELSNQIKSRDDLILNRVITYDACWMIFEPGITVFTVVDDYRTAFKLSRGNYLKTRCGSAYSLECEVIDWDGESFGWDNTRINIGEFAGTTKITKLSAFPLEYHPAVRQVKEGLTRGGKTFESLHGYHYKSYQSIAVGEGPWGPVRYNVSSFFYYI